VAAEDNGRLRQSASDEEEARDGGRPAGDALRLNRFDRIPDGAVDDSKGDGGVLYACANECGFMGGFEAVSLHEASCSCPMPPLAPVSPGSQQAEAAADAKQVVALRASLTKFYAVNSPHKMEKVDAIIDKFVDRGGGVEQVAKLNKSLERTYGAGLDLDELKETISGGDNAHLGHGAVRYERM